jgi:hypothetical protein
MDAPRGMVGMPQPAEAQASRRDLWLVETRPRLRAVAGSRAVRRFACGRTVHRRWDERVGFLDHGLALSYPDLRTRKCNLIVEENRPGKE